MNEKTLVYIPVEKTEEDEEVALIEGRSELYAKSDDEGQ